jgi:LPS-assembly lipoprotein
MWWSDRRLVLGLLAGLALAGCGFSPAEAPGGPGVALRGAVEAAEPTDREAFSFVNHLEDRLGRPVAPRFRLDYRIRTDAAGAGITAAGSITRYRLDGRVDYSLTRLSDGAEIVAGTAEGFTGWFATSTTVATLTAEEDAYRRLMTILADQVVTRLIAAAPE